LVRRWRARIRPLPAGNPRELARFLASVAPNEDLAVDVGCGNGQLTAQIAQHFRSTIGLDLVQTSLPTHRAGENLRYVCARAEALPLENGIASLITPAQAAHWFDLPAFYGEVSRIAAPDAILALISYGVMRLEPALQHRFLHFYTHEIRPYWQPERKLVDSGYADISYPFVEHSAPSITMRKDWDFSELLGYISTWSAVRSAQDAGQDKLLVALAEDLMDLWGDPLKKRRLHGRST